MVIRGCIEVEEEDSIRRASMYKQEKGGPSKVARIPDMLTAGPLSRTGFSTPVRWTSVVLFYISKDSRVFRRRGVADCESIEALSELRGASRC